jgi:flavin reductase (DIM6/NTAB) family NADH-FMN oxidoreductase RutF
MTRMPVFTELRRQQFRRYFQPSRIVLAILPAPTESGVNIITLSFNMYCSYKPPMMAVAIHNINESFALAQNATEFALAIPGESLAEFSMACGVLSMRDQDKVKQFGVELAPSKHIRVPGLLRSIANVELRRHQVLSTGDHLILTGEVLRFAVNKDNREKPLLSIGPNAGGFKLIAKRGVHRLATIAD